MHKPLQEISGAGIPEAALGALADLRCVPGITVILADGRAWLRWPAGEERVLERLLAVGGVELFVRRDAGWSRFGSLLPGVSLPFDRPAQPLAQALMPAPVATAAMATAMLQALRWSLVRLDALRATSALRCRASDLLAWSDRVTSARLAELQAVCSGDRLLVMGGRLPEITTGERFWGRTLLLPLGWRTEPEIPQHCCREILGLGADELLLYTEAGSEVVSQGDLQTLTRANVRRIAAESA